MSEVVVAGPWALEADAEVTVFQYGVETWVHVSSSSAVTWDMVEAALVPEVRAGLIGSREYRPQLRPTEREREAGHWLCDDWVFSAPALGCLEG